MIMPKKSVDDLYWEQEHLWTLKERAHKEYLCAKRACNDAYRLQQEMWELRCDKREFMCHEYEILQVCQAQSDEIWDNYHVVRDKNDTEIKRLMDEASLEHQTMLDNFAKADLARARFDLAASDYEKEAKEHRTRRDKLNLEVQGLIKEMQEAKAYAEIHAMKPDPSDYIAAKKAFAEAREAHEGAKAHYRERKAARDEAYRKYDFLQKQFDEAHEKCAKELEQVRAYDDYAAMHNIIY